MDEREESWEFVIRLLPRMEAVAPLPMPVVVATGAKRSRAPALLLGAGSSTRPEAVPSLLLSDPLTLGDVQTGVTRDGAREPLRAGRSVLDLLGLAQGIHRFVDGQEDCRFERASAPPPLIASATAAMDTLSGASHRL